MCFQPSSAAFHPQLVQVVAHAQKVEFRENIGLSPGEKTVEFAIAFQNSKGTFHLNGAVSSKSDPTFGFDVLPGTVTEPE